MFQSPEHQFLTGSVRAELEVSPRALNLPAQERRLRTDELLAALRLGHLADANPFTLSGGEKRRLSVAGALATRPRMLVLDEPTFGQDASTWRELVRGAENSPRSEPSKSPRSFPSSRECLSRVFSRPTASAC